MTSINNNSDNNFNLKNKFLLHVCCATCALHPYFFLSEKFEVTLYFYNPNIHPRKEYERRLKDIKMISQKYNIPVIVGRYEVKKWLNLTSALKEEPEGGRRCNICYKMRMKKTASTAKRLNFDFFGTSLTISPHKNHVTINSIGKSIEHNYNLIYFESNFKKRDGFKKTIELSKKLNIYRQNYCGCIYSRRDK